MTREGVDYSEGYPGAAALRAAGKTFVCRYVPYNYAAKGLQMWEKNDLRAHGIDIAMVFEMFADDPRYGWDRGVTLARMALNGMNSLGFPSNMPIYFAVDWDATTSGEFAAIDSFLRGAASVIGAARVGIYGGVKVINHCARSGSARWFWQTYAWSYGALSPYTHIYQYNNYARINGAAVDLNRSYKADFGQWPRPATSVPDTSTAPSTNSTAEGLPVKFIARPGWKATIIRGKPRRAGATLGSTNYGASDKDQAVPIWFEVVGQSFKENYGSRWFGVPQWIGGTWRVVYTPLIDLKLRNFPSA